MLVKNNVTINRKMVNVELTDLIGDITTHPDDHTIAFFQKPDGEREELGEFLYQYLQRRFGVENMITEWGYNLYDACGRYSHDPRIGLFYGILQKEVRLTVFFLRADFYGPALASYWRIRLCNLRNAKIDNQPNRLTLFSAATVALLPKVHGDVKF